MHPQLTEYLKNKTELADAAILEICACFKPKSTKRNEILVGYTDVCQDYYFIQKGCIRLYTINIEGLETSRYFAFKDMFCTALPSFIDQKPAHEYLQTIEASKLLVISRDDFYGFVNRFPQFDRMYRKILEFGFITSQKRIYGFQGLDALEKVRWVIQNQPHFLLRVSNKMAASYLGISPSTLSRIKSRL